MNIQHESQKPYGAPDRRNWPESSRVAERKRRVNRVPEYSSVAAEKERRK